jgi:aspartate/methionine/tyrosine aminotransferase
MTMKLPDFKLERYFAEYEFKVEHNLFASDCESMPIRELLAFESGAAERFEDCWLGYTESPGAPSLRRAISGIYETVEPDEVLVHTGAEEAIFLFMQAALSRGDHVIVHWPCYQSLTEVARSMGCRVTRWEGREEDGWALDPNELKRLIEPDTRVIVLNTPHNPTGYLMDRDALGETVRIARGNGILLFSDEVYRESEHDPADRLPAACDLDEMAVSLGVMSKTYGLPGLRIGWIATRNRAILQKTAALKDYTTICNSAPAEFLAELALRHRDRLVQRNVGIIIRNLKSLDEFFRDKGERFSWHRPKAGPIGFPKLRGEDAAAFCRRMVTETGVLLLPGTLYDHPGNHFRIGFGRRDFAEGLARLQ